MGQSDESQPTQFEDQANSWDPSDSDASRNASSVPQYHLFGLGTTQTQTQVSAHDGDSLKSGLDSPQQPLAPPSPPRALPPPPPLRPPTPSSRPAPSPIPRKHASEPSPAKPPPSSRAASAPRARTRSLSPAPTRKPRALAPRRAPKRARSPSPASEDSFAAPAPFEDPEAVPRPRPANFDIPLSQLQRGGTQDDDDDEVAVRNQVVRKPVSKKRALSRAAEGSSMSVVRALTQQELPLSPSSSLRGSSPMRGDDASPSASQARSYDNSQLSAGDHAQPLEASLSQEDGNHTDHSSQPGVSSRADTSVEGGFSVHGFSPDHDEDSQPHAGGSAQPMAFVATQPAISDGLTQALTQPATQPAETQPYDNTTGAQWQSMATTSTGARNLLANVPPEKRHRYQRYMPAAPPPTSDGNTQVVDEILPVQTGQELFEQILAHSNKTGNGQQETHAEDHDDGKTDPGDQMDVVPDSEPTQHPPTSSPERPLHLAIATASSSRDSEARSRYITPPEEQDEEEEVPLAAQRANTAVHGKGKGKARGDAAAYKVPFPKTSQGAKPAKAAPAAGTSRAGTTPKRRRVSPVHASGSSREVPSSMPHQDLRGASASSARATAGSPDPGRDARRAGSRATPVTPTKSRAASSLTPLSDEQSEVHETQPDPLDLISGAQDDDQKTELADEDGEEYDEPPPTKGSRKRKRAASAAPKAALRASMRASKAPSAADSIARLPKRGRGPSASRRSSLTLPTRVFARWDNLMWFYSGVVRERGESSTQFVIDFDDETHCPVELKNIRRGLLQAGDSVKVVNPELHGTVVEADEERATLQMQDGGERVEPVANIMVHARAITGLWGGRVLALEDIVPRIQPRALADTPSPSKASVLSAASAKHARSRVLAHIGFVVTLSAGCPKRQKADIEQVIRAHGGTVLEDWSAIFPLATEYAAGKKRWIAKAGGLHTKKLKDGISQVFLISDKMNQKPKYLVALALGIPCLSAEFLKSALTSDDVKHWARYLLPAGSSETLNACLSQLVDLDWGATPEHLTDIMKNSVAPKIFAGKSILVVGAEYFPVPPALRGKKEEGESSVPRIIVSMGADRVEAVPELRYASPKVEFDYVIWPKLDEDEMDEMEESWVSFPWVKDCLVAGRLLPLPQL